MLLVLIDRPVVSRKVVYFLLYSKFLVALFYILEGFSNLLPHVGVKGLPQPKTDMLGSVFQALEQATGELIGLTNSRSA